MQTEKKAVTVRISGLVQGVGFRPFVYRLAAKTGINGSITNSPSGVIIEAEGDEQALARFLSSIEKERPPNARIDSMDATPCAPKGKDRFEISPSSHHGMKTAPILPDIATCEDCIEDVFDPSNRRYLYPFTNCTNCGPRFTIIEAIPYDRRNTTMKDFTMCDDCAREYEDPSDRRFHAQPNACPACGPHAELLDNSGRMKSSHQQAMEDAASMIKDGKIVAVKGLGGFHLMCDAQNEGAVISLRKRKRREEKPLAVMFPDAQCSIKHCAMSEEERELLESAARPIVILRKRQDGALSKSISPNNNYIGAMLPYTPMHHILMRLIRGPVIATSGNLSEEPICIDEHEAISRLGQIADAFLVHNRRISRQADDSVVRMAAGRPMLIRRSRGYAPAPITSKIKMPVILGFGAQLKSTAALSIGSSVILSQHIGDLENARSLAAFRKATSDLAEFYCAKIEAAAHDMHPDYMSTRLAQSSGLAPFSVQHHHAHVMACMLDNGLDCSVLGVAWDGTGYGTDRTVWGGEFLITSPRHFQRAFHLKAFMLPGAEAAVREPRRSALGVLYMALGDDAFENERMKKAFRPNELFILKNVLKRGINAPSTSSAGRLFDAVASLLNVRDVSAFEGQAAMELEFLAEDQVTDESYSFSIKKDEIEYSEMVGEIIKDLALNKSKPAMAAKFHNTLCEMILEAARRSAQKDVVLCGGCFQNKYLLERSIRLLRESGFSPHWPRQLPANDGSISAGQVYAAAMRMIQQDV